MYLKLNVPVSPPIIEAGAFSTYSHFSSTSVNELVCWFSVSTFLLFLQKIFPVTNKRNVAINDNVNKNFLNAIISTEDKNFYKHNGFDIPRIVKSIFINIKSKDLTQGASTITQQYARNLFLTFEKTWERKIKEAWYAFKLETQYSKDEILEGYLNTINYGNIL